MVSVQNWSQLTPDLATSRFGQEEKEDNPYVTQSGSRAEDSMTMTAL